MKAGSAIVLAGAAGVAGFIVWKFYKLAKPAGQAPAGGPRTGAGDAATVFRETAYRDQLTRELAGAGDFYI